MSSLDGSVGSDKLYGGDGQENLGGKAADLMVGGTGDDNIYAVDGTLLNDIVYGGNEDRSGELLFHDKATIGTFNGMLADLAFGIDEFL